MERSKNSAHWLLLRSTMHDSRHISWQTAIAISTRHSARDATANTRHSARDATANTRHSARDATANTRHSATANTRHSARDATANTWHSARDATANATTARMCSDNHRPYLVAAMPSKSAKHNDNFSVKRHAQNREPQLHVRTNPGCGPAGLWMAL